MLLLKTGVLEGKNPVNYDYRTRELAAVSLSMLRHFMQPHNYGKPSPLLTRSRVYVQSRCRRTCVQLTGFLQSQRARLVFERCSLRTSIGTYAVPIDLFLVFPQSLQAIATMVPRPFHLPFHPNPFCFMRHKLSYHPYCNTDRTKIYRRVISTVMCVVQLSILT